MPAPTRDFRIDYGTYVVGTGSSAPVKPITGALSVTQDYGSATFRFRFLVTGTTPSDFATNCTTAEAAFRKPNQNFKVTVGDSLTSAAWFDYSHDGGTGFDARAEIEKLEEGSTGLSRIYSVRVTIQLPADQLGSANGRMGRRESTVSVALAPSGRRTVTIAGVYTAVAVGNGVQTGRGQYDAQIAAYASAVLSSLDSAASWELIEQPLAEVDDTDDTATDMGKGKVLRFQRTYEEILFRQGSAATDAAPNDADIVRQRFSAARARFNRRTSSDNSPAENIDRATISYECSVDKSKKGANLVTKWNDNLRDFVIEQTKTLLDVRSLIVVEENVDFNFDDNLISATIQIGGLLPGTPVLGTLEIDDNLSETGQTLVPVWSGDPHARYQYQGPSTRTRTIRFIQIFASSLNTSNPLPRNAFTNPTNGIVRSHQVIHRPRIDPNLHEQKGDIPFIQVEREEVIVIEYFALPGVQRSIGQDLNSLTGIN